jgi:murein DD-endopeptidase MepM/ murein hydrolase activator NlpD
VTSGFGERINPITNKFEIHNGIDIAAPIGTPVLAVSNGIISETGSSVLNGRYIWLETDEGYKIIYAHLDKIHVNMSQRVERGEVLALSGNTGRSSGPHLHYGVYKDDEPLDPASFLKIRHEPEIPSFMVD